MDKNILDSLEKLFTKQQSQIYLYLLDNPGKTVYQIAKALELSRSTVYPVVESMYNKGYLLVLATDSQCYFAENPDTLIRNLRESYNKTFDNLKSLLKDYSKDYQNNYFLNINSPEANLVKAKEILINSEKEIYINTDLDIHLFDEELTKLEQKNVKIYLFSFRKQDCPYKNIELYSFNETPPIVSTRIMIVSDYKVVFTSGITTNNNWIGTITNNPLMINIISEHIHHDIYLYKLQDMYKRNKTMYDIFNENNPNSILIHSEMEKRSFLMRLNKK